MSVWRSFGWAAVVALVACSKSPRPAPEAVGTPPETPLVVSFAIPDITTDSGQTVPSVYMEQGGGVLQDADVQAVAGVLQLLTYPELSAVRSQMTVLPANPPPGRNPVNMANPFPGRVTINVVPSQPLSDRWYVLSLSSVPSGVTTDRSGTTSDARLGAFASRFRPGSGPVIQNLQLCAPSSGGTKAIASFSEGVVIDNNSFPTLFTVTSGTAPSSCAWQVALPPGAPGSHPPQPQVQFNCPAALWSGTPQVVTFTIQPGLVSGTGAALGVLRDKACAASPLSQTLTIAIDFSNATLVTPTCKQAPPVIEPDNTPPVLAVSVDPTCLWPPNHDLVLYHLGNGFSASATDDCDPSPNVRILGVSSNQPVLGGGSGNTSPDILFGAGAFCVRSERDGMLPTDREYAVDVQAQDAAGNATTKTATVRVPHDQSGACPAVPSGRVVQASDPRCISSFP